LGHEAKSGPISTLPSLLRKTKNPAIAGLLEWRDPDSNWGHHDFQTTPIYPRIDESMPVAGISVAEGGRRIVQS
jgi:hypothetical protein